MKRKKSKFEQKIAAGDQNEIIVRAYKEQKEAIRKRRQSHVKLVEEQDTLNMLRHENTLKNKAEKLLDHYLVTIFMTLITIYALFFDNLRIIAFNKKYDDLCFGITLLGIVCYTLEIVLSSWAKSDYLNTFFFWLDIFSTISMIPDCEWIWKAFIDTPSGSIDATDLA